jgi:hypothetical protein
MQYGFGDLEMVASLYSNDPNDYLSRYGTNPNNIFFGRLPNYAIKGFEDPKLFGRKILQNVALPGYEGGNIVLATPEQVGVEGYDDGILRHETRHIGIRDIMNHPRFAEYAEQLLGPEEKENLMYFRDYLLSGPYTEVKKRSEEYLTEMGDTDSPAMLSTRDYRGKDGPDVDARYQNLYDSLQKIARRTYYDDNFSSPIDPNSLPRPAAQSSASAQTTSGDRSGIMEFVDSVKKALFE